jgi:hypothetical protein
VPTYTIFGLDDPVGVVDGGTTVDLSVSTAFFLLVVSGWRAVAVRIFVPAGVSGGSASGQKAYLWTGVSNAPTSMIATVDFPNWTVGAWNTAYFTTPVTLLKDRYYWAQVFCPLGGIGFEANKFLTEINTQSVDTPILYASSALGVATSNGSYVNGVAGQAPDTSAGRGWFGVDILIDDGFGVTGPGAADPTGITDLVTVTRSGVPSTVVADATATDATALVATGSASFPVGSATAGRTVRRALFDYRVAWGAVTGVNTAQGPALATAAPASYGLEFTVQWAVQFVGCRIFKHPDLAGAIPIRLWDYGGPGGSQRELGIATPTWVADAGGWVEVIFTTPINLVPGIKYYCTYFSPTGVYVFSGPCFSYFSDVVAPLHVAAYVDLGGGNVSGGSVYLIETAQRIPSNHSENNYYIEPIVEWYTNDPYYVPDIAQSYFDQFTNGGSSFAFPIGVWFADPEFLVEYAAMGVNTLVAGGSRPDYVAAIKASGLDHWPNANITDDPTKEVLNTVAEDPVYAAHVKGYHITDEPDLVGNPFPNYKSPSLVLGYCQAVRKIDSTRPTMLGFSEVLGINQTFYHMPVGSNMDVANADWRLFAQLTDVIMGDFYTMSDDQSSGGRWGVWTYDRYTKRMRQICEDRVPVWNTIETTSQTPGQPLSGNVVKACWASLISGAQGLIFFDHRFQDTFVTQDFAAMLHDPPMKAAVSAMIVQIMSLADALKSPEANLVTSHTSSNTTAGPYGGTLGVRMHFTSRDDGAHQYLFAMSILPGATTATFTIPSWAGETVTVLDESRTVTVDGSGVLTDTFAADYTVHLYQK